MGSDDVKGAAAPPTSGVEPDVIHDGRGECVGRQRVRRRQVTTIEPLTVVELAPRKSVEIEARTRLSLRLTKAGARHRGGGAALVGTQGAKVTARLAPRDGGRKVSRALQVGRGAGQQGWLG